MSRPEARPATTRPARLRRRAVAALAAVAVVALSAGCDAGPSTPAPPITPPSATSTQQAPITVVGTDTITTTDPVAVTDQGSMILSLNVFQRLMTADPGEQVLKPDAARDCLFTAATVYTCTLNEGTRFHNGHPLTSSDVRFSIERARRLGLPGSSAPLLDSLRSIETPDPVTVRFLLTRVDTQFGLALASPAASIVDEEVYAADQLRRPQDPIIGSGPFSVVRFADQTLTLARFPDYRGRNPAQSEDVVYRAVADSLAIEDLVAQQSVDVVWRGLSDSAVVRYSREAGVNDQDRTDAGYVLTNLNGTRVRMLLWDPDTELRSDAAVRAAVSVATQSDRTLDSILPGGIPGHISAFPVSGVARPQITWKEPKALSLGYDRTAPGSADLATVLASRLEATKGFEVTLRPTTTGVDLAVVDRKAFTATGEAWLEPYLAHPLPAQEALLSTLLARYRTRTDEPDALSTLAAMQNQAALDRTVLPLTQTDDHLLIRTGVQVQDSSFGPGWQLGLFGIARA